MDGVSILLGATIRKVEGRQNLYALSWIRTLRPERDATDRHKGEQAPETMRPLGFASGRMDSCDRSLSDICIDLFMAQGFYHSHPSCRKMLR